MYLFLEHDRSCFRFQMTSAFQCIGGGTPPNVLYLYSYDLLHFQVFFMITVCFIAFFFQQT